jgi:lysine-specific demethylase 3
MDVADAINIMVYASEDNGKPGCAVWDVFRAEDSDQIREFLSEKFRSSHSFTDPIHSQLFYLDSELRKELHAKTGVVSWRIYQYPVGAQLNWLMPRAKPSSSPLVVPTKCAISQTASRSPWISSRLVGDYLMSLTADNIRRCQQLTDDFRMENFARVWKDDVLQLYNVLWYVIILRC